MVVILNEAVVGAAWKINESGWLSIVVARSVKCWNGREKGSVKSENSARVTKFFLFVSNTSTMAEALNIIPKE